VEPEPPKAGRRWIWPLVIAFLILAASHRPQLASTGIEGGDKVIHFAVYGLLATLVCRLGRGWRAAGWAFVVTAGFGATDEWHQSFVPGRSVELADWIADALGAGLAVVLYTGWRRYREWLETPLFGSGDQSRRHVRE
jgi:VanZ family protein